MLTRIYETGELLFFMSNHNTQHFFLVMIYVHCDLSATLTAQIDVNEKKEKLILVAGGWHHILSHLFNTQNAFD